MTPKSLLLHGGVIAALFAAQFVVSEYVLLNLTRIMILAVFASGYNLLFGYTGLLSLGHAMFFAAGAYVAALGTTRFGLDAPTAFIMSTVIGTVFSAVVSAVALRASGVAFMIVTLMFSQAAYLTIFYFGDITRGDEGIVIADTMRRFIVNGAVFDLANPTLRYNIALALLALVLLICAFIVTSSIGRVMIAIRENENRTAMLGYDVWRYKFVIATISGALAAVSGAAYALMFAYAGATLASIEYSINPLLWTLLGGASTLLGPVLGTAIMFTLRDVASSYSGASLLTVGVVLILLVLFFPKGLLGALRAKVWGWLP
jgi:branched-chain amino acid transport system permease protein